MTNKFRLVIFVAIVICMCALFGFGQHAKNSYMAKCGEAAGDLLGQFQDMRFDGVSYDGTTNEVYVYVYVEAYESSSVLERRVTKVIVLEPDAFEALSLFKNVKWCCDGLFFASTIDWNGEWSGIYFNSSMLPQGLKKYERYEIKPGYYWLSSVPDHIMIE